MTLSPDVNLEEFIHTKDDLSGADIKVEFFTPSLPLSLPPFSVLYSFKHCLLNALQAICTEAGLLALRERRMKVTHEDFKVAKEKVLYRKNEGVPEGLYM